jgi:hypothetical protein
MAPYYLQQLDVLKHLHKPPIVLTINIYMKRYKATVNAAGMWVETILYAQNPAQAYKLFQAIFGANNVPHQPLQIG